MRAMIRVKNLHSNESFLYGLAYGNVCLFPNQTDDYIENTLNYLFNDNFFLNERQINEAIEVIKLKCKKQHIYNENFEFEVCYYYHKIYTFELLRFVNIYMYIIARKLRFLFRFVLNNDILANFVKKKQK